VRIANCLLTCGLSTLAILNLRALRAEDCREHSDAKQEFIVKLKLGNLLNEQGRADVLRSFGLEETPRKTPLPNNVLSVTAINTDKVQQLRAFAQPPLPFEYVEANLVAFRPTITLSHEPLPNLQWHLAKIDADEAWRHTRGDPHWIAAIIDMGVDIEHPALSGHAAIVPGDDGNVHGRDFTVDPPSSDIQDESKDGHGTHVAGIMVGSELPSLRPIVPNGSFITLKIGRSACLDTEAAIEAIRYAAEHDVAVANLSWEMPPQQALRDAIEGAADILFVAAATDSDSNDANPHYPVAWRLPNVIAVTSTTRDDELAGSYGYRVDIAVPGDKILSTLPAGRVGVMSGTSMAAPMVSATALLLKSLAPHWSAQDLKHYLIDSAVRPSHLRAYGFGRLDAARATAAPVAIDWPRKDSFADSRTNVPIKWHSLFSSSPCRLLDAELSIDDGPYRKVLEGKPIDNNQLQLPVPPVSSARARVRLKCSGTELAVQTESFQLNRFH
jgi:subtilisin family serine protease